MTERILAGGSVRGRHAIAILALAALLAGIAALALAGAAHAAAQYDLRGTWDTYGTGGGYSGTFTVTTMNRSTGAFSGTGDGSVFELKGTESGSAVSFTQSEGSYVSHDRATLRRHNGLLEMVGGTWHDSNGAGGTFTAKIKSGAMVSGTINHDCLASCRADQGPVSGVTVTAKDGSGDSETATTDAAGSYSLDLPTLGTWTLRPSGRGLKYDPKKRRVAVAGDRSGIDFTACGALASTSSASAAAAGPVFSNTADPVQDDQCDGTFTFFVTEEPSGGLEVSIEINPLHQLNKSHIFKIAHPTAGENSVSATTSDGFAFVRVVVGSGSPRYAISRAGLQTTVGGKTYTYTFHSPPNSTDTTTVPLYVGGKAPAAGATGST